MTLKILRLNQINQNNPLTCLLSFCLRNVTVFLYNLVISIYTNLYLPTLIHIHKRVSIR